MRENASLSVPNASESTEGIDNSTNRRRRSMGRPDGPMIRRIEHPASLATPTDSNL